MQYTVHNIKMMCLYTYIYLSTMQTSAKESIFQIYHVCVQGSRYSKNQLVSFKKSKLFARISHLKHV
jgi:hypothetical protein